MQTERPITNVCMYYTYTYSSMYANTYVYGLIVGRAQLAIRSSLDNPCCASSPHVRMYYILLAETILNHAPNWIALLPEPESEIGLVVSLRFCVLSYVSGTVRWLPKLICGLLK